MAGFLQVIILELDIKLMENRMPLKRILLAATAIFLFAMPSFAYIYENPPRTTTGVQIQDGTTTVMAAVRFVLSQDAYATCFSFGLGRASGPADAGFDAYLTDVPFGSAKTAIASWDMAPKSPVLSIYDALLPAPIFLKANTMYSVMVRTNASDFMGAIAYSGSGYYGYGSSDYGSTWRQMARPFWVRIDGYAVPEPSSMWGLLSGGIMVLCALRRSRFSTF